MAHLALYRKYRPASFDEVIGQDHIVKTLINQIKNDQIGHAYLFCGTRGTGKTSCARLLAKAINCTNPQNGSPCGECEACKSVGVNGNLDIIEIDAASNNRVDEIRDLREKVKYFPTVGKYKVYIVDEVHMLTDSAFNALLKTLEEPPAHAVFILATTEPQKLPATILSRCMRFDFKLVSEDDLFKHIKNIFTKSKIEADDDAIRLIAKCGEGSVRDTMSVAEMCVAYCNGKLSYALCEECLGITNQIVLENLCNAILNKDGGNVLSILNKTYTEGKKLSVLLKDLCDYFRNLLTYKLCGENALNVPKETLASCKKLVEKVDANFLLNALKTLNEAEGKLRYAPNEKVLVETAVLSCFYDDNLEIEMLKQKIDDLSKKIECGVVPKVTINTTSFEEKKTVINEKIPSLNEKVVFGELLNYLRTNKEMILYSSISAVQDFNITNNNFNIYCVDKLMLSTLEQNKKTLQSFFDQNYSALSLQIILLENKEQNIIQTLKEKFDNKIIIK